MDFHERWFTPVSDHEHDHNCAHEAEGEFVVLTDEKGESYEFQVLDFINVDGRMYAILGDPEDAEQAIALRFESNEEGNEVLVDIEDDEEWQRVAEVWAEVQEEGWDEGDDEDNGDEDGGADRGGGE